MRISDWSSDVCSSDLDSAFSDIEPTKATIYLTLKKGHEQSSVDWEREMAPKLQDIADARVNFQSQSGGGFGRDITIMLGSGDPELLETTAHQLVQEMEGIKEIRAHRLNGDFQQPEILIPPHIDLSSDLGVPTSAPPPTYPI